MAARGQCPGKDSLHRRISFLKNSAIPATDQLKELLHYESLIKNCPYNNDSTHEILLRRIATICIGLGDFTNAALHLDRACNLIVDNAGSLQINRKQVVTDYYFLSTVYDSLHNTTEKRKAQDLCIDMSLRFHIPSHIAALRCRYAREEYLFDIGDYHRCADEAQTCERLANDYVAAASAGDAKLGRSIVRSSHGWRVEALLRMGEFETAEQMLTNKAAEYKKNGLTSYLGFFNAELAEVQLHKGNHQKALEYFNRSLQYYKAAHLGFDYKQTLKAMGEELYFDYFHDAAKAMQCYHAALQHNRPLAQRSRLDSIEDASILSNIANAWVQFGNYDSAFACFRQAFNLVKPGSDETGILNSSDEDMGTLKKIHYLASLLIDKADAYRKKYTATGDKNAVSEANRIYRVTDQLLGRINTTQHDLQSRLFWRADTRRLYEHAIDLCWLQDNADAAFYFFEKSRAVLLNDQLAGQWLQGGDAIAREGTVKRMLPQLEQQLKAAGPGTKKYTDLKNALNAARKELDSLGQQIKLHNPLYYQGFLDTSHTTLADVRNTLLNDHASLFEIFYGDSAVYALLATTGHSWLNRIDKGVYDSSVQLYLSYLRNPAMLNRDFNGYAHAAKGLYTLIFNNHPLPKGRIIVSPDGRSFPLEALITDIASSRYMLYDYAVSYTYSARYLQNNFAVNAAAPAGNFLGVAPVRYRGMPLAALEGSDQSLERIGAYFGSSLNLVTGEASREHFLSAFSNYRFIQLYTHSSDSSSNKEPVIYFADLPLYLSDLIPKSKPAAQLIVLSACETGNGRFYRGEGVFSFNRGFAALGIPCSVSNLWSVDNTSTYRITELFYKYIAEGLPLDIALQKAKIQFIKMSDNQEKQLPYYWAASIVIGKANAINYPRSFNWVWIGGLLVLLVFGGWVFFWFGKRS